MTTSGDIDINLGATFLTHAVADEEISTANGSVTLTAGLVQIDRPVRATSFVVIQPPGPGSFPGFQIGGTSSAVIGLTDAELDNITAPLVQIGGPTSPTLTLAGPISPAGTSVLRLVSGGAIVNGFAGPGPAVTVPTLELQAGTTIGTASAPLTIDATTLTTQGSGDQFLAEANSASVAGGDLDAGAGTITLAGGTFLTTAGGDVLSAITVGGAATLGGVGITATVNVAGTISPGASLGIFRTGDATFAGGSTFAAEINGPAAGSGYDRLEVSGNVNLGSAMLSLSGGYVPGARDSFVLLTWTGSRSGTFAGLPNGAAVTFNGVNLVVTYDDAARQVRLAPLADPTGVVITGYQIDDGNLQRSMVRSITLTFSSTLSSTQVTELLAKLTLTRLGGLTGTLSLRGTLLAGGTQLKLTFTGTSVFGSSLADGRYELKCGGETVIDSTKLFRLFGDINGDGQVDDVNDQPAMTLAMNTRRGPSANYNQYLDYGQDGVIINSDQTEFGKRKGKKLAADGSIVPI